MGPRVDRHASCIAPARCGPRELKRVGVYMDKHMDLMV